MRKLLLFTLLFSALGFCQTQIPPNMIAPGGPNTCLQTNPFGAVVWSGCATGGGGGGYATIQNAGVAIAQRNTINFLGVLSCVDDGSNLRSNCSLQSPLPVANGGTSLTTLSAHQLYVGNGTSTPNPVPLGTAGQVLESNGATSDPSFQDPIVSGPDAPGTAPSRNPVQIGAFDGTNVQRVKSDTSGNVSVNVQNFPGTQPVSGTITTNPPANASTNVTQFGGTALSTGTGNGGAGIPRVTVSSDSFPATQPVSGTVTSNAGTGTFNIADTNAQSQGSTTSGQKGYLNLGAVTTSPPVYTTGQTSPISLDTSGNMRTTVTNTVTVNNTQQGTASQNVAQIGGSAVSTATTGVQLVGIEGRAGTSLETTAGVLDYNFKNIGNSAVSTVASGVQKVGITGNTGAAVDTSSAQNQAMPANMVVVGGEFNTTPTTVTSGNASPFQLDSSGNLNVNVKVGGGTGGTSSNFASTFPSVGTAIGVKNGANMVNLLADASGNLLTNCIAGCAAAGDQTTGSTALGALNATITIPLAGERGSTFQLQSGGTGVYTVTPQCSYDGGAAFNTNGYIQDPFTGAISTTATIASAQATTDYPVMCPQGASNAQMKVTAFTSGTANWLARATVNTWPGLNWGIVTANAPSYVTGQINGISLDTSGLTRVSLKDTPSNTNNFNVNIAAAGATVPVSGTVSTTPPSNASTNVTQYGGTNVVTGTGTSGAGIPRVTVASDSSLTANQGTAASSTAGWPITGGILAEQTAAWTSATASNTTLRETITGYNSVVVYFNQTTTITGGVATFEVSDTTGFTNAYPVQCSQINGFVTGTAYTFAASTNQAWSCGVTGYTAFQVRLSTVIAGTGTVNVGITANAMSSVPDVAVGGTVSASSNIAQVNGSTVTTSTTGQMEVGIADSLGNGLTSNSTTFTSKRALDGNVLGTLGTAFTKAGTVDIVGNTSTNSANAHTPFFSAANTTAATVKSSAGNLYGYYIFNPNSSACFLQVFNTTSPTLGTTTPIFSFGIPGTGAANLPPAPTALANFGTAISVASTTTANGATTCTTGMTVNVWFD